MKALIQKIRRILKDRRTRQMLTRIISVSAAVVVFVTTYALVLPAITMETEAQCGIEAHQHSDECYTDELVCEIPESPGHVHTDTCYELSQVLVCETPEHKHSVENGCYDEDGNLICELAEHHHTEDDGCYKEVKELMCDIPESEGHTHDSSCYKKVLTCGKEVHTHSTACYHIDAASKAATEAAAVASTESAAIAGTDSMMSTKASTTSEAAAFTDNLSDDEIDESNIGTIGSGTSTDLENVDTTSTDADAAGADPGGESGTWTPAEETVDSAVSETNGGAEGSTASAASSSTTSSTSSTASTSEKATEENAGYVPVLEELNINAVINNHTGIYYYHPESDSATDSNEASTEDSDGTVTADNNNNTVAVDNNDDSANTVTDGSAIPVEDWHRIPDNTEDGETPELGESDLLRVYLAYTIPAGSLNETNTVARYRLPENIRFTDEQINTINSTVNGIAAQYVNMDTLEFLDVDQYNASLGIESVEGTRTPDQDIQDYLNDLEKSGKEASEYINATVRVENVFNEDSGDYEGQDLVFTFTPYSILKNQHEYDKDGQPTRAGEELQGWVSLDLTTDQIEWITSDNDDKKAVEKTADIVFVEKDQELDVDEISTELKLVEKASADDIPTEKADAVDTAEATEVNETEASRDEEKEDNKAEATEDDETAENEKAVEEPAVNYPSVSFDDSITVTSGPLSTDTTGAGAEENTEITVHVEADEDTFPEGTTMRLAAVTDDQMAAVTEAIEGAMAEAAGTQGTAGRTQGFHALDISFWNADGIEIEPLKPIRVSMTSEAIKRAVEDSATAPVVVHVEDGHAAAAGDSVDEDAAASEESVVEPADDSQIAATSSDSETVDDAEAGSQTLPTASIIETATGETKEENTDTLSFEAGAFSVYAIVYTVDFEYSVNGKMYQFSLPGGGFVSFTDLVEVLGITHDTNSEDNEEEIDAVEVQDANGLLDVEASDTAKKFVANVASVEFSNPELVGVSKIDADTTIGQIKESRGLECEYSAELTEEQIAEINAQTVDAGDWVLISVQPFTSEESLTVTMKNGDQFVVKVTDGQIRKYVISDSGDTYEVIVTYDDTAEIPEDAELRVREIKDTEENYTRNIDASNRELQLQGEPELVHPVQFDIAIVSGGEEVEPKEGSIVNVEIRLAKFLLEEDVSAEENSAAEEEMGMILFNGQEIALDSDALSGCRIAHIAEDGTAEIIEDVESSMTDDKIVMQFETESFSDYLFDGNNGNGLNNLPPTIYVGDEIYMWNQANYWVSNIGSVVTETKANNSDNHKTVTAINTGTFRIYNRYNQNGEYREIRVLPARTGTTPPATIDTINNASIGLTLNLFDYDLNGSLDSYFNGSSHNDNPLSTFAGSGINSGNALKFWGSGIGNNYGSLNQYVEHGVTSIVSTNLNSAGYPVVSNSSGGSGNRDLSYLFTPSNGTDKKAYTNVNGLFKKDGDYYVYDSNQNYAWYNPSTNRFDVYNGTYNQKSNGENGSVQNKSIGFFPFHPWDNQYDLYVNWNKNLNHHFGMSMSVPFSLPKDPKAVVDTNKDPIIFEFSGDDDLWVFIDGKLAMDIGGIHQPTSGTINFQTGVVTVNGQRQLSNNQFNSRFPDLYDGKQHTLQVFYIERGGCDSNCMIKFNMTLYGDVHFDKVDEDHPSEKLAGAVFGIYKDANCMQPLMENLKNNTSRAYVAESDANGHVQFSDIPLGTYYLKELHAPEGYPLDNTIHTVEVYYDQTTEQVKVKVTIDGLAVEDGVTITNKQPHPLDLGLVKVWQNEDGGTIAAPAGATTTFEIKRIRNYETYTEQTIEGSGRQTSHLTVGWIHNGETHIHGEYDLIAGSTATVSWGYNNGYTGSKDCIVNGTRIDKDYVTSNVVSEALTMPAAGGTSTIYIVDDSENGEAIRSINVAGQQFYGNSGGGVIHTFETITEPDPDFSYSGANVTNNQVTLPINSNTWNYDFADLPTFGRGNVTGVDHEVAFNYSYYLEEVSSTSPEGTTVVYKDINGNIINSATAGETSTSGTQTITNKVPTGYLRIDKEVTFNGVAPTTDAQKSALAGEYKFKVYTDADCSKPYKVIQGAEPNQQTVDLELTVTIGDDGVAKSSDTVKIPVGDYWIEEQTPSQTAVTPDENRIKVTITADQTANAPAVASFTNNKEESDNPDELAIELEKTFTGLPDASKIPSNYKAVLTYKYNGSTVPIDLTGSTQGNVTCIKSADGLTWHWRVTQIPKTATDFGVSESNYDITGYTRITKINGNVVENPAVLQGVTVLVPEITMTNLTDEYTTTDNNKVFTVEDNQILLVRMTNHATVICSQKSLSLATRQAIEKMIIDNGGKIPGSDGANAQWVTNFVYFSHEIQGDSFSYGGRTIYFDGNKVKIPHNASSHEVRVDIGYTSTSAENSFTLENSYTEIPVEVDVLKVEKGNETSTQLSGAVFELRKLQDVAPTNPGGTLTYVEDNDHHVIVTSQTTGDNGRLSFSNLTHGVYEIRESTPPPGYIQAEDVTFYLRVDGGEITYVQKGSNKPSEWTEAPNSDDTATVYYMEPQTDPDTNATFRVSNTPGVALPHTGGPGTKLIYLFGIILAGLADVGLVMKRRRRNAA